MFSTMVQHEPSRDEAIDPGSSIHLKSERHLRRRPRILLAAQLVTDGVER